jgi:hypothetical protein
MSQEMGMTDNELSDEQSGEIETEINPLWPLENDVPHVYVNQFSYSTIGNEVILGFGSFLPTGFHNRNREEIENYLKGVQVNPLVKVVMSKEGFQAFYQMLKRRAE